MEDIYALLNINKDLLQDFHLLAERTVDHQTELVSVAICVPCRK